jgi:hypothetical protein
VVDVKYALTIYSDTPLTEARVGALVNADGNLWPCESCADGIHGPVCPYRPIVEKMAKMEALIDQRIAFYDELLCMPAGAWARNASM